MPKDFHSSHKQKCPNLTWKGMRTKAKSWFGTMSYWKDSLIRHKSVREVILVYCIVSMNFMVKELLESWWLAWISFSWTTCRFMGLPVGLMICYSKRSQTKQDVKQFNRLTNTQFQRFVNNTAPPIHNTSIILAEAISSATRTESSSRKMNKFICTKKKKLLSSWNISLPQILMLVNSLMLSISTTYMKRVQQSLRIAWKGLWRNSLRITSVWWQWQELKVQTSITPKFQSCWVNNNFRVEECPWWSQERLYLHL